MATRKKKEVAAPAKTSKAAELRNKDVAGLQAEIKDLQKAHFGLRMQKATQQLTNTVDAARARAATSPAPRPFLPRSSKKPKPPSKE